MHELYQGVILSQPRMIAYCVIILAMPVFFFSENAYSADEYPLKSFYKQRIVHAASLRYKLIMSEDDALCGTLKKLYNQLLKKRLDSILADPADSDTAFERDYPESYHASGLESPPIVDGEPGSGIYLMDVENDHNERMVFVADSSGRNDYAFTRIGVLKKDFSLARDERKFFSMHDVEHSSYVERRLALGSGSLTTPSNGQYKLEKWPNLASISAQLPRHKNGFVPEIDSESLIRPFIYSHKAILIADSYESDILSKEPSALVVAYAVTSTVFDDLCYLHLGFPRWWE